MKSSKKDGETHVLSWTNPATKEKMRCPSDPKNPFKTKCGKFVGRGHQVEGKANCPCVGIEKGIKKKPTSKSSSENEYEEYLKIE